MLPGYSVWIEIQANKATISDARKFRTAMQHCAEAGVDAVLLSVRDTSGYVLYPSTLAPSYSEYDPTFAPGVDYLRQCLEICRQEGIALYAAMDVFVGGNRNDPRPEMPAPMQVARYLFRVTLMPAASAVAGFSPTARRFRPMRVRFRKMWSTMASTMARYTIKP